MLERYVPENATTEKAYYATVDPYNKKTTYADWLFETGFIDDPADYTTTDDVVFDADATVTHQNLADLGFIPLVTPTSQIVGTQSVINVLTGERYKSISKETAGVFYGLI